MVFYGPVRIGLADNARFVDEVGYYMSNNEPAEIKELSFEEAIASLEHSVRKLEGNSLGLELSLAEYAKAANLIAHCQQKLYGAKSSIDQLKSVTANGKTVTEPWADPEQESEGASTSEQQGHSDSEEPRSKRRRPSSTSASKDGSKNVSADE